jgi:WD40 repeat protein
MVSSGSDHDPSPSSTDGVGGPTSCSDPVLSGVDDRFGFVGRDGPWGSDELPAGTDLGGVKIVRLLAAGGMGRVYEGRQEAPSRIVAVKVVRDGLASPSLVRRFEYEAEVLARLRHPNIAQIYTFGIAAAERGAVPFFVMELVEAARSITTYAAEESLSTRRRVSLFRRVCAAVVHGHQKGVIHRDLKPGNILVDGMGEPKVIDFGVARSIDGERADATWMTRSGDLVGTLRYMSPEQLGIDGRDVDARTDVYSLGLVLHELLTGTLPYDIGGRSVGEAVRVLGDQSTPSTGLLERTLRDRGRLGRTESRALATIVGKCLEKRPGDRYASAVELDAELGRWEAGDPILARPPTSLESVVRFSRRHRAASFAAAGVVMSLVAAVTGISFFYLRAERERALADRARLVAEQREDEAARQAAAARSQLYISDILLAAEARDRNNVGEATRLLDAARSLVGDAGTSRPIELDCLAASLDESVHAWQGMKGNVTAVAWSPDGRRLATGASDGTVRLLQVSARGGAEGIVVLEGHEATVWSAAFSPDGSEVATASADGHVRLWNSADGSLKKMLDGHDGGVYAVAFSHDGRRLVTASQDRSARIWDTETWETQHVVEGHQGTVFGACFSPDDAVIATASADRTIRLWDAASGDERAVLVGHEGRVFGVAFAPSGSQIASASEDGTARLRATDGGIRATLQHPFRVNAVAFLGNGERLTTASGDGVLRIWNTESALEVARLRGHTSPIWSVAAAPDTGWVATGAADGIVRTWDADFDVAPILRGPGRMLAVGYSPNQALIATAMADSMVLVWDASTLRRRGVLRKAVGRVNDVRFSPDAGTIAGACDDGTVQFWDAKTFERRSWIKPHERRTYSVDFSPDGRLVATAAEDRTARLWSLEEGRAVGPPFKHPRRAFCAAFSPDGAWLATACEDRIARLWSVADGTEVRRFPSHEGAVNWVAFSADGRLLATACSDGAVRLWNTATGELVTVATGPSRQIWKVAFAPDGRRVAAVSADGTAQIWDVASGRAAPLLRGHADQVWGVAFAPDGRSLVTGSWDGTARVWGVSVADIARRRNLADAD